MSRIKNLFEKTEKKLLSIYFTAGFPELNDTTRVLKQLEKDGVDLVEIGMPFSDPLADGPVIQESSQKALKNGMNLKTLFEQLKNCRDEVSIPIVLMGYLNPVMRFGLENFLRNCQEAGVDGVILPDLPLSEFEKNKALFEQYGIAMIFLVTPETADERLKTIDLHTTGFLYAVSSSSTTGKDQDWKKQDTYFKRLQNSKLQNPVLVGFGIKDKTSFQAATQYTDGAIIGTAFIKAIQKEGKLEDLISNFITEIR